jgi:chemotaxis family two-component system sensor kinase Cph1
MRVAEGRPRWSLEGTLQAVKAGDHVCALYNDDLEHLDVIVPFIRIGLKRGEKCVYLAEEGDERYVEHVLFTTGIDVAAALERKALVLLSPKVAHLKGNSLDPYRMFTLWKQLISDAQEQGFSRLRGAGDMQWMLRGAPAQRWLAYERHLTQLAADRQCLLLCQYCRANFRAEQLVDVIRAHPRVIHRGTLAENIYYQPTEVVSQAELYPPELDSLLNDLHKPQHVD